MSLNSGFSFQRKRSTPTIRLPGTKPSFHNSQLVTSIGLESIDALIDEDVYGKYSLLLLKHFCAEAVTSSHKLFIASLDPETKFILETLPNLRTTDHAKSQMIPGETEPTDDMLKIAWRYKHLPPELVKPVLKSSNTWYDIGRPMPKEMLEKIEISRFCTKDAECDSTPSQNSYNLLTDRLDTCLQDERFKIGSFSPNISNVLRIALHSLGSPLWEGELNQLLHFLYKLRAVVRSSFAVCMITVPSHLFQNTSFVRRMYRFCDLVVKFDSFQCSSEETNQLFVDYQGVFSIKKLPKINTLSGLLLPTVDLGFSIKKKRFTIMPLTLPPEISRSGGLGVDDLRARSSSLSSYGCASSVQKNKLDF